MEREGMFEQDEGTMPDLAGPSNQMVDPATDLVEPSNQLRGGPPDLPFALVPSKEVDHPSVDYLLPRYKSHKYVNAMKILEIEEVHDAGGAFLRGDPPMAVFARRSWLDRYRPEVGGYFVQYGDGYCSFSPAKAFEEGYTRIYT